MARDTHATGEAHLEPHTQEELLAMLCHTRRDGAKVAELVRPEHFDGPHKDLATAVLEYRRKYQGKPPGKASLPTLLNQLPVNTDRLEVIKEIASLLPMRLKQCNREFVHAATLDFVKRQTYRGSLLKMLELANKETYEMNEMETLVQSMARQQPNVSKEGILFNDFVQSTKWLDKKDNGWSFGFDHFDNKKIRIRPQTLTLYPAPKNSGKSWFCIHTSRMCMMQGASVLHITLEMSQDQVAKRYYQSWFGMATIEGAYWRTVFEKDEHGLIVGWNREERDPRLHTGDPEIWVKLRTLSNKWNKSLGRLRIQEFPTSDLTPAMLENYLDSIAASDLRFQPDVIFVDYPDLMKIDTREYRHSLSKVIKDLRGIAQRRNLAVVCPTQVNRMGMGAKRVRGVHVAEAIEKINSADLVITYSQTDTERELGIARLLVEYSRDHEVGMELVLAQAYHIGQYATDYAMAGADYKIKMSNAEEAAKGGQAEEGHYKDEADDDGADMFRGRNR
jgi:replicative DNA helicase